MLTQKVPWQFVIAEAYLGIAGFIGIMLGSLLSGYFNWFPILTAFLLIIAFAIIVYLIPVLLNLSRAYFKTLFILLITHISITILSFSLHYKSAGLIGRSGYFEPGYLDAIYFSITTYTTLGYGDFQPMPVMRLATSMEALSGMISMAIGASLIWLWCQENTVPKEMAFFDGLRLNKKSLTITKVRIRSLSGKEREKKDWMLPPEEGGSYYFDPNREEWIRVTDKTKLPKNAFVMGIKKSEEES